MATALAWFLFSFSKAKIWSSKTQMTSSQAQVFLAQQHLPVPQLQSLPQAHLLEQQLQSLAQAQDFLVQHFASQQQADFAVEQAPQGFGAVQHSAEPQAPQLAAFGQAAVHSAPEQVPQAVGFSVQQAVVPQVEPVGGLLLTEQAAGQEAV